MCLGPKSNGEPLRAPRFAINETLVPGTTVSCLSQLCPSPVPAPVPGSTGGSGLGSGLGSGSGSGVVAGSDGEVTGEVGLS